MLHHVVVVGDKFLDVFPGAGNKLQPLMTCPANTLRPKYQLVIKVVVNFAVNGKLVNNSLYLIPDLIS